MLFNKTFRACTDRCDQSSGAGHSLLRRGKGVAGAIFVAATVASSPAMSQTWPTKPIYLIVGTPPGGPIDSLARILAEGVTKQLKQPVIVENRSGASGTIALSYTVAKPPDGYTVLITANAAFSLVPLVRKTTYKPIDDFSFLGQLAYTPNVFVVPASLPAKNMKEFVALAKSNPGKFSYGMMPGVPHHLDFERFKKETGTDIVFVGYRGGTPIVNGLLGEEVQATLFNEPLFSAWVKAGKIRALATTAKTRTATMPDVPTLAEAGFPNLKLSEGSFYSLAAPAGMPKELGDKLFKAFSDAAATPETSKRLEAGGFEVKLLEGGALKQEIRREYTENEKIVKTLDIKLFD